MRNILFVIVIIPMMLFTFCDCASTANANDEMQKIENDDVRNVRWGMTRNEVIKIEKGQEAIKDIFSQIIYKDKLFGYPVTVAYNFEGKVGSTNWRLKSVGYSFKQQHENKEDFLTDWDRLVTSLTEKYGMPQKYKEQANDGKPYTGVDARKDSVHGLAMMTMDWKTERTKISVSMGNLYSSFYYYVIYEALVRLDEISVSESEVQNKL